jgi:hypothetical protein
MLTACPEPAREALDRLAIELASKFVLGQVEFREADDLANVMFAYATKNDVLGHTLHKVFLAFDAGECVPGISPANTDPIATYTRPQLAKVLTSLVAT